MNSDRGEIQVTLDGVVLDLRFKARNLQVLTRLTGKNPIEFVAKLEGMSTDDRVSMAKLMDFDLVVPLIVAGLAKDQRFGKLRPEVVEDRICTLLDNEASKKNVPILSLVAQLGMEILPVFAQTLGIFEAKEDSEEAEVKADEKKSEQEEPSSGDKQGSSLGDA